MPRRSPNVDLAQILTSLTIGPGAPGSALTRADGIGPRGPRPETNGEGPMLNAATELISTYGLRRWTMDDVASRSGLARATVYRRFETRDLLVRAVLRREARRFFTEIAAEVQSEAPIEDQLADGFVLGLRFLRRSPLMALLRHDPEAALTVVRSDLLLRTGRVALVDRYEAHLGVPMPELERARAERIADVVLRLGLSYLLTPEDPDTDEEAARAAIHALVKAA